MSKMFTIFAAHNILRGGNIRLYATGFFYAYALQLIHGVTPVGNCNRTPASKVLCNGSVTPSFCYHKQLFSVMHNTEKNCLSAKDSTCKQRRRTKRALSQEPQPVQVIHQIIIPERPIGLIGEKVVFTDKFLKDCPDAAQHALSRVDTPYFTIIFQFNFFVRLKQGG